MKIRLRELAPRPEGAIGRGIKQPSLRLLAEYCRKIVLWRKWRKKRSFFSFELAGRQREIGIKKGAPPDGGGTHVSQGPPLRIRRPLHRTRVLRRHIAVDQHGGRRRRRRNLARVPVHSRKGKF